jgi:hypothetical protein
LQLYLTPLRALFDTDIPALVDATPFISTTFIFGVLLAVRFFKARRATVLTKIIFEFLGCYLSAELEFNH